MKQDQYNILSGNNVFSDDDEIKRFFEKEGFEIEKYSHLKIFGELTSVKNLGLSQEEIVKIKQILNIKDTFNAILLITGVKMLSMVEDFKSRFNPIDTRTR
jgi:hypothetical protein